MPARSRSKPATAKYGAAKQSPAQVNLWIKLFEEIDTDNSGAIDVDELFEAMSSTYPALRLTYSDIVAMIDEADTNYDGVIDLDEFITIMTAGHGKNDLWGKVSEGMYGNIKRNVASVGNAIHSSVNVLTAPIRQVSAEHSYIVVKKVGGRHFLVSTGMRFFAMVVTPVFAVFTIMLSASLFFIPGPLFLILGLIGMSKGKNLEGMFFGWHFADSTTGNTYGPFQLILTFILDYCLAVTIPLNVILMLITGRTFSQHFMNYDVVLD